MSDRWQSDAEICTNLGIKKATVYKCISEKDMPAHRLGELWKFKVNEVDEWLKLDVQVYLRDL